MKLIAVNSFLVDNVRIKSKDNDETVISSKSLQHFIDYHQALQLENRIKLYSSTKSLSNPASPRAIFLNDVEKTLSHLKDNLSKVSSIKNTSISTNDSIPQALRMNAIYPKSMKETDEESRIKEINNTLSTIIRNKEQFGLPQHSLAIPFIWTNKLNNISIPYIITNYSPHTNKSKQHKSFTNINEITSAMFFIVKYMIANDRQLAKNSPNTTLVVNKILEIMHRYGRDKKYSKDVSLLFKEIIRDNLKKRIDDQDKHDKYDSIHDYLSNKMKPFTDEYMNIVSRNTTLLLSELNEHLKFSKSMALFGKFVRGKVDEHFWFLKHVRNMRSSDSTIIATIHKYSDLLQQITTAHSKSTHSSRINKIGAVVTFSWLNYINSVTFSKQELERKRHDYINEQYTRRLLHLINTNAYSIKSTKQLVEEFDKVHNYLVTKNNIITDLLNNTKSKETSEKDVILHQLYRFVEDDDETSFYFDKNKFAGIGASALNANYELYYKELGDYVTHVNNVVQLHNSFEEIEHVFGGDLNISATDIQREIKNLYPTFIKEFVNSLIKIWEKNTHRIITHRSIFPTFYRQYVQRTSRNQRLSQRDMIDKFNNLQFKFHTDVIKYQLTELLDTLLHSASTSKNSWLSTFDSTQKTPPKLTTTPPVTIENEFNEYHIIKSIVNNTNLEQIIISNLEQMMYDEMVERYITIHDINKTDVDFPIRMENYLDSIKQHIINSFEIETVFEYALQKFIFVLMSTFRNKAYTKRIGTTMYDDKFNFVGLNVDKYTKTYVFSRETIDLIENIFAMIDKYEDKNREIVDFKTTSSFGEAISYDTIKKMGLLNTNLCIIDSDETVKFVRVENGNVNIKSYNIMELKQIVNNHKETNK